jgi:hypothetical protein
MKLNIFFFILIWAGVAKSQKCEDLTLEEEVYMSENIALVQGVSVVGDSVQLQVLKKWKGDSISNRFSLLQEPVTSKSFRLDSGKTYLLLWYHGFSIDRCSRTSDYKYVHFEFLLDELFKKHEFVNVPMYDSLKYKKDNILKTVSGQEFDVKKGKYAFYDLESGEVKAFDELPKETSFYYPRRFYIIDTKVETASVTYDVVFAMGKSHQEEVISTDLKKKALQALFK